ncbi:hypothetical protein SDC9_52475 [bioreactor metagenome]|uniref:Uncharacterized protein n=1 Tax=bioreactor metagenome TaxID=1076179 RepID=A0A644WR57_9ZZZZ
MFNDVFARNILIMTDVFLGGRRNNRFCEFLVFYHSVGHGLSAERAFSGFVFAPGVSGEISADHHFNLKRLGIFPDHHRRMRDGQFPVGNNVSGSIEKLSGNKIEYLTLVGNSTRQNHIECRNTVTYDHYQ